MSELNIPESWAEVRFKQIVINDKDGFKRGPFGSALKKEFFVESGYQVYEQKHAIRRDHSLGTYYIDEKKYQELKGFSVIPNDFIVSCSGTLGKIYQIPANAKRGIINQALLRLRINRELYLDKFFELYFSSPDFQKRLFEVAPGSAQVNMVGVKVLKEFELPLPPIHEQRRMVQKIESCFSKINETEQNLNKVEILLEKYRDSLLAKAFRGELIPQNPDDEPASVLLAKIRQEHAKNQKGKKKEQEFTPISDDEKPFDIPENWIATKLYYAGDWGSGGTPLKSKSEFYGGEINLMKTGDLTNGFVTSVPDKITKQGLEDIGNKIYPVGTVVMAMYGATIGKLGLLKLRHQ